MRIRILLLLLVPTALAAQAPFRLEETTIAAVHAAFRSHTLTCRSLVQGYLDRIPSESDCVTHS